MRKIKNEIVFNEKKKKLLNIKNSQLHAIFEKFYKIFHEKFLKKPFFKWDLKYIIDIETIKFININAYSFL